MHWGRIVCPINEECRMWWKHCFKKFSMQVTQKGQFIRIFKIPKSKTLIDLNAQSAHTQHFPGKVEDIIGCNFIDYGSEVWAIFTRHMEWLSKDCNEMLNTLVIH